MQLKNFDPQKTLGEIKSSLLAYAAGESPKIIEAVESYVAGAETRITDLVSYVADGDGDTKFLLDRLSQEKDILLSEILSLVVLGKGVAQDALNNVQNIILEQIKKVLDGAEQDMQGDEQK